MQTYVKNIIYKLNLWLKMKIQKNFICNTVKNHLKGLLATNDQIWHKTLFIITLCFQEARKFSQGHPCTLFKKEKEKKKKAEFKWLAVKILERKCSLRAKDKISTVRRVIIMGEWHYEGIELEVLRLGQEPWT